jgi:uncharacterized membrane protein
VGYGPRVSDAIAPEPRWPASVAALVAAALLATLPDALTFGPRGIGPAVVVAILLVLTLLAPMRRHTESRLQRALAIALIAALAATTIASLVMLVDQILSGDSPDAVSILVPALQIQGAAIVIFGLAFWELDEGGPHRRIGRREHPNADFRFPQIETPEVCPPGWRPRFVDYLYVAYANAATFGVGETVPLTHRVKLLLMSQSAVSLTLVTLVAARAVSLLE